MRWSLIGLLMLLATPALAHDAPMQQSMYADWLHNLQSRKGICCNEADGNTIRDVDWEEAEGQSCVQTPIEAAHPENKLGTYCVRIEGTWWYVPDAAVITEPNKSGLSIVWIIWTSNKGERREVSGIRCFLKGAET